MLSTDGFLEETSLAAKEAFEAYFRPLVIAPRKPREREADILESVKQEARNQQSLEASIRRRLSDLKQIAISEGLPLSRDSETDLAIFIRGTARKPRPNLFLLGNGNFRAVWKGKRGEQIALQFRGNSEVQFVIFAIRSDPELMVRLCGRDTLKGIVRVIKALEVIELISDEG